MCVPRSDSKPRIRFLTGHISVTTSFVHLRRRSTPKHGPSAALPLCPLCRFSFASIQSLLCQLSLSLSSTKDVQASMYEEGICVFCAVSVVAKDIRPEDAVSKKVTCPHS